MTRPLLLPRLQQLFLQLLLALDIALRYLGYLLLSVTRSMVITPTNNMLEKIFTHISKFFTQGERDRIYRKFDHFDERMDRLEQSNAEIRTRLDSMNEVSFANNEALEQKLNAAKSGQQQILSIMDLRFSYAEDALKEIKALLVRG